MIRYIIAAALLAASALVAANAHADNDRSHVGGIIGENIGGASTKHIGTGESAMANFPQPAAP